MLVVLNSVFRVPDDRLSCRLSLVMFVGWLNTCLFRCGKNRINLDVGTLIVIFTVTRLLAEALIIRLNRLLVGCLVWCLNLVSSMVVRRVWMFLLLTVSISTSTGLSPSRGGTALS